MKKIIILIITLLIIYLFFNENEGFENIQDNNILSNNFIDTEFIKTISSEEKLNHIPKIIHQTAPSDVSKWKNEWISCQNTWKTHFPSGEYIHIMWTDEDLDNFIKNNYPWFYSIYKSYNANIKRIDIARYFILYKYGGIYADMDYMCNKNFYSNLPQDKVSISESPYKENEFIQNALMASNPGNPFWIEVIKKAIERKDNQNVLYATGPKLVSDTYFENPNYVFVLNQKDYNPKIGTEDFDKPSVITKHVGTKSWI